MAPPRADDEGTWTYILREYLLPGIVFMTMIRWLYLNVIAPSLEHGILPERRGANWTRQQDIDLQRGLSSGSATQEEGELLAIDNTSDSLDDTEKIAAASEGEQQRLQALAERGSKQSASGTKHRQKKA